MSKQSTPVKKIKQVNINSVNINDTCRICSINIPISVRGRLNIFEGAKSVKEKVAERLSQILQRPVLNDGTSSTICYKCKRDLEKLEKAALDLAKFKEMAERSTREQRQSATMDKENTCERFKRCKCLNSPSKERNIKRKATDVTDAKVHRNILQPKSTLTSELPSHEDLFTHNTQHKPRNSKVEVSLAILD
jgi:hypothetical protein